MTDEEKKDIQAKVDTLPIGGITYKTINGKKYPWNVRSTNLFDLLYRIWIHLLALLII